MFKLKVANFILSFDKTLLGSLPCLSSWETSQNVLCSQSTGHRSPLLEKKQRLLRPDILLAVF
jgi:hypothetical protein